MSRVIKYSSYVISDHDVLMFNQIIEQSAFFNFIIKTFDSFSRGRSVDLLLKSMI